MKGAAVWQAKAQLPLLGLARLVLVYPGFPIFYVSLVIKTQPFYPIPSARNPLSPSRLLCSCALGLALLYQCPVSHSNCRPFQVMVQQIFTFSDPVGRFCQAVFCVDCFLHGSVARFIIIYLPSALPTVSSPQPSVGPLFFQLSIPLSSTVLATMIISSPLLYLVTV